MPTGGFHQFQDIEVLARGTTLPFSPNHIARLAKMLGEAIDNSHVTVSLLQKERAKRFFEVALHQLNTQSLIER